MNGSCQAGRTPLTGCGFAWLPMKGGVEGAGPVFSIGFAGCGAAVASGAATSRRGPAASAAATFGIRRAREDMAATLTGLFTNCQVDTMRNRRTLTAMPATRPARRLPPAERRAQLGRAALELAAERGYADFSLDAVAERAGVTRNLVYHYFPRGRLDLFLAALHEAGQALTSGWVTDPAAPLEQRVAANFAQMMKHAAGPSAAWRVHRQARTMTDPDVRALAKSYVDAVVSNVALNNTGSPDTPPLTPL